MGPEQTDSLVATLEWMGTKAGLMVAASGVVFLRADCVLKRMFNPIQWIEKGLAENKAVFPFKVWDDGGPADQIFFVPSALLPDFDRSVKVLMTRYKVECLNRQSLHFLHTKKCMRGQLAFAVDVVCDANSIHEWNPLYRITGREEKRQSLAHMTKWGPLWFNAAAS